MKSNKLPSDIHYSFISIYLDQVLLGLASDEFLVLEASLILGL
jgi:hypothetical protein